MSHDTVAPQNAAERLGAFLFPLRGIPGILFFLVLVLGLGEHWGDPILNWAIGLAILIFGEGMRVVSRRYIGRSSSTRTAKVSHLVTGGPYRFVRNPIYIGNLGILVGFAGISGLWWTAIIFTPLVFILYYLIASYESRIVVSRYPEEGAAYVASVPAWVPSVPAKSVTPSEPVPWPEVFWRERKTLIGIAVAVAFCAARELHWIPPRFF